MIKKLKTKIFKILYNNYENERLVKVLTAKDNECQVND